jgi:hypothetical protein
MVDFWEMRTCESMSSGEGLFGENSMKNGGLMLNQLKKSYKHVK